MSPDAVIDEARGLVFSARIRITGSKLRAMDGEANSSGALDDSSADYKHLLSPGLTADVEIEAGKRSVLSYLLSSVALSVSEAGRER